MTYQGPDVWVQVGVPEGVFRIAFYIVNYDGNDGGFNRFRDYLLEMKACPDSVTNLNANANAIEDWEKPPTLARARVQNFWGGGYQCFIVTGPAQYALKIGRNYSFNTICQAVFVDRVLGPGFPTADNSWLPFMEHVRYQPPPVPPVEAKGESPGLLAARDLWAALDDAVATKQGVEMVTEFRLEAYRTALIEQAPERLLANWRWKMPLWTPADRNEFSEVMKIAWDVRGGLRPATNMIRPTFQ